MSIVTERILAERLSAERITAELIRTGKGAGGGDDPRLSGTVLQEYIAGRIGNDAVLVSPVNDGVMILDKQIQLAPATQSDNATVCRTKFVYYLRWRDNSFQVYEYDFGTNTASLANEIDIFGLGSNDFVRANTSHDGRFVFYERNANGGDRVAPFEVDPLTGAIVGWMGEPTALPSNRQIIGFCMNADATGAIFTFDQSPYYGGLAWNNPGWGGLKPVASTGGVFGAGADCSPVDPNLGVVFLANRLAWVDPASPNVQIIELQTLTDRSNGGARFSPDGKWLAVCYAGNTDYFSIYDTATRQIVDEIVTTDVPNPFGPFWITNESVVYRQGSFKYRYAWDGASLTLQQTL